MSLPLPSFVDERFLRHRRVVQRWAMMCVLAFFVLAIVARFAPASWQDATDGVRGAVLGAAMGLMIVSMILKRRRGSTGVRWIHSRSCRTTI